MGGCFQTLFWKFWYFQFLPIYWSPKFKFRVFWPFWAIFNKNQDFWSNLNIFQSRVLKPPNINMCNLWGGLQWFYKEKYANFDFLGFYQGPKFNFDYFSIFFAFKILNKSSKIWTSRALGSPKTGMYHLCMVL